ncbi:magnesium transporter [bacterium]|nr:magnesium transporter [bacterium]MBU1957700.1 magnesium transporter [bacterium]
MSNRIDLYLQQLKEGLKHEEIEHKIHHADMADYLEDVKRADEEKFFEYFNALPLDKRAETCLELPTAFQIDLIKNYDASQLAEIVEVLKSDDATDFFLFIAKKNKEKADDVFSLLNEKRQEEIEQLTHYEEHEAGSLMQTELFKVKSSEHVSDALEKLAVLKAKGIGRVESLFVTDEHDKLLKSIFMDDLILEASQDKFSDFIDKFPHPHLVSSHESIDYVLQVIEKYDLSVLAVVDRRGHLIGRITHDDVVDMMQERATKQIYNLNKLHADEEIEERFSKTSRSRAIWLSINLLNAIIASLVIGLFESTLEAIVALAVLMPIVANMAGTASVQTMTVVVRQMGLGEINFQDIRPILFKEMNMAILNGLLFALLSIGVAQIWFENYLISIAIGLSMFVSFVSAGVLGATVPMLLKKIGLDPAVASSVVVITLVDIIGFFSFLWFAELIVL